MELPPALRQAVDAALEGVSARDLADGTLAAGTTGEQHNVLFRPRLSAAESGYLGVLLVTI